RAKQDLVQVVERAPNELYERKLLVASLLRTGQIQRATEALEVGLLRAPEDPQLLELAGETYLHNNEFAKAAQYFDKAAKLDPKSAIARLGLGLTRLRSGEIDLAQAELESAVQLDADEYRADILLVTSNLDRANYDQALKAMESLEKKQPNNPLTYNLKGTIYKGKKDAAAARKALEHAL